MDNQHPAHDLTNPVYWDTQREEFLVESEADVLSQTI